MDLIVRCGCFARSRAIMSYSDCTCRTEISRCCRDRAFYQAGLAERAVMIPLEEVASGASDQTSVSAAKIYSRASGRAKFKSQDLTIVRGRCGKLYAQSALRRGYTLAVRVDHLRLDPQAELHLLAHGLYPRRAAAAAGTPAASRCPLAEKTCIPVRPALAERAGVDAEQLDANVSGLIDHRDLARLVYVEIYRFSTVVHITVRGWLHSGRHVVQLVAMQVAACLTETVAGEPPMNDGGGIDLPAFKSHAKSYRLMTAV